MKFFTTLFFAILVLGSTSIITAQQSENEKNKNQNLELGKLIEKELAATEIHSYLITLKVGEFLRGVVNQHGIDIVAEVYNPCGEKIFEVDSPNGNEGPEPIDFEVKTSGLYKIAIRSLEKNAQKGKYDIRINEIMGKDQYAIYLEKERIKREEFLEKERNKLEAAKNWISENAIHLKTVEAGNGFEDMLPLKKIIGNAHIVSLGEATHGTREFFQLKHRMLEFLVTEMGFTVFGIEATMPEGFDINEYVLTGKGDPSKAPSGLYFWTWNTKEVLDMILWMRKYNEDPRHVNKVKFYGFDMQSVSRAAKVVLNFLKKVDKVPELKIEKTLAMLANPYTAQDFSTTTFESLSKEIKETTLASINKLINRLDENKDEYINSTNANEWSLARQHVRILNQNVEMCSSKNFNLTSVVRDRSMAENIGWILEHEGPETKMVVWAHNLHVANDSMSAYLMGNHLRKKFDSDMVVFGFAFNQGSFNSREFPFPSEKGLHSFTVGHAKAGSLDSTLAAAGLQIAAIDLHKLPKTGLIHEWFNTPKGTRNYGAGYRKEMENNFFRTNVARIYDALLFIEKTTASFINPGGKILGVQKLVEPSNLDFETGDKEQLPFNWVVQPIQTDFDFNVITSDSNPDSGKQCAMISRMPGNHYGETFGNLHQRIDASKYRGKKITLQAAIRTEVTGPGNQAYMWLRIMKKGNGLYDTKLFYDNMADRPITTKEWRDYEIVGDVPMDADTIDYGFALVGDGKAWFDSVSLEIVKR